MLALKALATGLIFAIYAMPFSIFALMQLRRIGVPTFTWVVLTAIAFIAGVFIRLRAGSNPFRIPGGPLATGCATLFLGAIILFTIAMKTNWKVDFPYQVAITIGLFAMGAVAAHWAE